MGAREHKEGKHLFWLGVNWEYAKDKNIVKGIRQKILKAREQPVLVSMGEGEVLVGGVPKSANPHYIGALLMANLLGSAIFVQSLDENSAWVMICESGHVLPGRDLIVDADKVNAVISEWMRDYSWLHIIGDIQGSSRSAADCWKEIIEGIRSKTFDSQTMQLVSQTKTWVVALTVILAAGAGVAAIAIHHVATREGGSRQSIDMEVISRAKRAIEEEELKKLKQAFEQEKKRRTDALMKRNAGYELLAVIDALKGKPGLPSGVKLQSVLCVSADAALNCNASAQIPQSASFAVRRAVIGDRVDLVAGADPVVTLPSFTVNATASSTDGVRMARDDWDLLRIVDDASAMGFTRDRWQPVQISSEILQSAAFQSGTVKLQEPDAELWKKVSVQLHTSVSRAPALVDWLKRQPCALKNAEIIGANLQAQVFCWRLTMDATSKR